MKDPHKISLRLLLALKALIENPEGLSRTDLAGDNIPRGTAYVLLKRLEKLGLTEVEKCPISRGRPKLVYRLKPKGREKAFTLLLKVQLSPRFRRTLPSL